MLLRMVYAILMCEDWNGMVLNMNTTRTRSNMRCIHQPNLLLYINNKPPDIFIIWNLNLTYNSFVIYSLHVLNEMTQRNSKYYHQDKHKFTLTEFNKVQFFF